MKFLVLIFLCFASIYAVPTTTDRQKPQVQSMSDFDSEFASSDKENKEEIDPLSGYNRVMTNFNDYFYLNILNPTAKAYKNIMPKPIRKGVANIFDNLMFPLRFANNLLQFKIKYTFLETQRFLLNSTIGIVGFFDVANDDFHIKEHDEDFGQTLGFYGIGSGFHIVLPILGPSNVRDTAGIIVDGIANPMTYIQNRGYNLFDNNLESYGTKIFQIINYSSLHTGEYEKLKKDAVDLYPFLKNIYEQRRKKQISE